MQLSKQTVKILFPYLIASMILSLPQKVFAQDTRADTAYTVTDSVYSAVDTVAVSTTDESEETKKFSLVFNQKDSSTQAFDSEQLHSKEIPDSILQKMRSDDAFWYVNAGKDKQGEKKPEEQLSWFEKFMMWLFNTFSKGWGKIILWMIIIGSFLGLLVWLINSGEMGLFTPASMRLNKGRSLTQDDENIFETDFPAAINSAVKAGDYRLAVRLHFLQVLRKLSEREVIQYSQGKTNFDYLLKLQPTGYYKDFAQVTRIYEYVWYGKFLPDENSYRIVEKQFNDFGKRLY